LDHLKIDSAGEMEIFLVSTTGILVLEQPEWVSIAYLTILSLLSV
jgi:hypothetical protein